MMGLPSGPRSRAGEGFCPAGAKGSGPADTQQAIWSTSRIVSGQADCEDTGTGLAHAPGRTKETRSNARIIAISYFKTSRRPRTKTTHHPAVTDTHQATKMPATRRFLIAFSSG